ncbi:MAG: Cyclopropane-fatty-acyl-phospholipid synthase [Pelotomaculum sp. PtaB.Bin104]|nr:MAG: Cyclopropane-fatty-acyl-phospholipid synthase [Pelotomaculum sp. PtaB.Bin104]
MQKQMFQMFFKKLNGDFAVTYWDGTTEHYGHSAPTFRLEFHKKIPYIELIKDPVLAFGEAYMDGAIEIHGEMDEIIKILNINKESFKQTRNNPSLTRLLPDRLRQKPLRKCQEDVSFHYDLGNDFFSLWLDETMCYSCAYFQKPEDSLRRAQEQKMEHVLKKLQLHPGETLLDIGSGWGGLILRAAQKYKVKAMGITLSREQYQETLSRIKKLCLTGQVEVALMDYRQLAKTGRTFDKIASIGMFEHIGQANYAQFMLSLKKLLKEGGLTLLHTITKTKEAPVNSWTAKYIFPGGYIPSLREIMWLLPEYDFHVIDLESLRLHYAMTLDRWQAGFDQKIDQIKEKYGERFIRMWRFYLSTSAASFRYSDLSVHQFLFSGGLNNSLPLTRRHLY